MGAGGQYITILPELDMVIAHKTDTGQISPHGDGKRTRSVTLRDYDATLRILISAAVPASLTVAGSRAQIACGLGAAQEKRRSSDKAWTATQSDL